MVGIGGVVDGKFKFAPARLIVLKSEDISAKTRAARFRHQGKEPSENQHGTWKWSVRKGSFTSTNILSIWSFKLINSFGVYVSETHHELIFTRRCYNVTDAQAERYWGARAWGWLENRRNGSYLAIGRSVLKAIWSFMRWDSKIFDSLNLLDVYAVLVLQIKYVYITQMLEMTQNDSYLWFSFHFEVSLLGWLQLTDHVQIP